jgi:hypothetical protein
MKSSVHPRSSGRSNGIRASIPGGMPVMSERQMEAYLTARDTIRRVQRTSHFFDSVEKDALSEDSSVRRHRDRYGCVAIVERKRKELLG